MADKKKKKNYLKDPEFRKKVKKNLEDTFGGPSDLERIQNYIAGTKKPKKKSSY